MIGGYIIATGQSLRTIEVFTSAANKKLAYEKLGNSTDYCEVCCFWIKKKYRKHLLINCLFWLKLAWDISWRSESKVLYGTNVKALAQIYNYPENSKLIICDRVGGKETFVFNARKKDFFSGVFLSVILIRFSNTSLLMLPETIAIESRNKHT